MSSAVVFPVGIPKRGLEVRPLASACPCPLQASELRFCLPGRVWEVHLGRGRVSLLPKTQKKGSGTTFFPLSLPLKLGPAAVGRYLFHIY